MDRPEKQRKARDQRKKRHPRDGHMDGEDKAHGLTQIVVDAASQANGGDHRGEVVVQQDNRRGFAGDVGTPPTHSDADVRGFQGRRIIHAVAGHRDHLAVLLERIHQSQFLRRHDPGKDADRLNPVRERGVVQFRQRFAGQNGLGLDAGLGGDGLRRRRIVAGDHHDPDPRGAALPHRLGHA